MIKKTIICDICKEEEDLSKSYSTFFFSGIDLDFCSEKCFIQYINKKYNIDSDLFKIINN